VKNLLPWLKSNWLSVVLGVIALAALPALWFVSSGMNKKLVEKFQSQVEADYRDVSNANVQYGLVSPTGERILEENKPVNKTRIAAYKAISEELLAQTGTVWRAAVEHNGGTYRAEPAPAAAGNQPPADPSAPPPAPATVEEGPKGRHQPLIEGLFPAPSELQRLSKPTEFARKLLREERPRLLTVINAGMPPTAEQVAEMLNGRALAEKERVRTEQGRAELDAAEQENLAKELRAMRLGLYQRRAGEIQVYADDKVFDEIPIEAIDKTASLAQVWDWQEKSWIHADLFSAIKSVNGNGRGVTESVIKRIHRIAVEDAPFSTKGSDGTPPSHPYEAGQDRAPSNFARSITGRFSGPGSNNKWYDVRNVTLDVVVDGRRLPAFFDALASVNFMTVVDVDLARVDPVADLREGFFYGEAPVARATLTIETIFFREWREPWMPVEVKRALGMDQNAPAAEPTAAPARRGPARPAPAPPPGGGGRRRGGEPGGD
jgi:hypothetical protein